MNGNMEIASSKLAEFIGKGDLSKGMVDFKRKRSNISNPNSDRVFKSGNPSFRSAL